MIYAIVRIDTQRILNYAETKDEIEERFNEMMSYIGLGAEIVEIESMRCPNNGEIYIKLDKELDKKTQNQLVDATETKLTKILLKNNIDKHTAMEVIKKWFPYEM